MGYIVLGDQLDTIKALTSDKGVDSIDLLWLPGGIQTTIWMKDKHVTHLIDEDGEIVNG